MRPLPPLVLLAVACLVTSVASNDGKALPHEYNNENGNLSIRVHVRCQKKSVFEIQVRPRSHMNSLRRFC